MGRFVCLGRTDDESAPTPAPKRERIPVAARWGRTALYDLVHAGP